MCHCMYIDIFWYILHLGIISLTTLTTMLLSPVRNWPGTTLLFVTLFPSIQAGNMKGVVNRTITMGYLVPWEYGWPVGGTMGSAIDVAIKEIKNRGLLPGYDFQWVLRDSQCAPQKGMEMAVDVWSSVPDLDVMIGPACSVVCTPVSLLAAAWNIPVVSYGCASSSLSDTDQYPTFSRTEGTWMGRAPAFNALVDVFGWKKIGIISTFEDLYRLSSIEMMRVMQQHNKEVKLTIIDSSVKGDVIDEEKWQILQNVVADMKQQVYILIIMTYPQDLRNILIAALDRGMMNRDYVFITNEYILSEMDSKHTFRPEADAVIWDAVIAMGVHTPSGKWKCILSLIEAKRGICSFILVKLGSTLTEINSRGKQTSNIHDIVFPLTEGNPNHIYSL